MEGSPMRRYLAAGLVCGILAITGGAAQAGGRPDKIKSWFGHVAGGYSIAQGDLGRVVDDGYELNGGAVFWPEAWAVGLNFDLAYSKYDVSDEAIRAINQGIESDPDNSGSISGGDVDIWSLSTDVMWGPDTGTVGFYLLFGVGIDRVDGKVTTEGLVYYPPVCSPWWYWCVPGSVGPGTLIVESSATTEWSYNGGIGLTFELGISGSQLFLEARYRVANTDPSASEYIPITLGYRW